MTAILRTEKTVYMNNAIPARMALFGNLGIKPLETDMKKIWKQKIDEIQEVIEYTEFGDYVRLIELYKKKRKLEETYLRCL